MHNTNNFLNVGGSVVDADLHCAASVKTGIGEQMLKGVRDSAHSSTSKVVSCLPSPPSLSATVLICAARAGLHIGVGTASFDIVGLVLIQELETKRYLW